MRHKAARRQDVRVLNPVNQCNTWQRSRSMLALEFRLNKQTWELHPEECQNSTSNANTKKPATTRGLLV